MSAGDCLQECYLFHHLIDFSSEKYHIYISTITARKSMKIPCVRACGFIGFTTAFLGAYASSSQRLMGFDPNAEEVAMYGALTPKEATDFEYLDTYTNSESLDSSDRKSKAS